MQEKPRGFELTNVAETAVKLSFFAGAIADVAPGMVQNAILGAESIKQGVNNLREQ